MQQTSTFQIGKQKVSEMLPFMRIIAEQQGLKLSIQREWNITKNILTKSVKEN